MLKRTVQKSKHLRRRRSVSFSARRRSAPAERSAPVAMPFPFSLSHSLSLPLWNGIKGKKKEVCVTDAGNRANSPVPGAACISIQCRCVRTLMSVSLPLAIPCSTPAPLHANPTSSIACWSRPAFLLHIGPASSNIFPPLDDLPIFSFHLCGLLHPCIYYLFSGRTTSL